MLHAWDGRSGLECGVKWGGNDGAFDEAGEPLGLSKRKRADGSFMRVSQEDGYTRCGHLAFAANQEPQMIPQSFAYEQKMDRNSLVDIQTKTDQEFTVLHQKLIEEYTLLKIQNLRHV